jgi:hypothetical protein
MKTIKLKKSDIVVPFDGTTEFVFPTHLDMVQIVGDSIKRVANHTQFAVVDYVPTGPIKGSSTVGELLADGWEFRPVFGLEFVVEDKKMKKFSIHDDSEFEAGMCSNGGHYAHWRTYTQQPDGSFVRLFHTTHEFGICPNCGDLCQSQRDWDLHEDCDPVISAEEALADLLEIIPRLGEKAQYFDGPAFRVEVDQ